MNKTAKLLVTLVLGAGVLFSFPAAAQPEAIDLSARGPQVGDRLPEFSLPDQNGEIWTQESIIGDNGTMLVFLRSADW